MCISCTLYSAVYLKNQRFFRCTGIRPIIQQKYSKRRASTSLLYFCWMHCSLFHTLYHNLIFATRKEATFAASFKKQQYFLYFFVIYPCAFKSSAHRIAPPAAPRTVLWDKPTNFQSYTVSSLKRPTDTPIPFS